MQNDTYHKWFLWICNVAVAVDVIKICQKWQFDNLTSIVSFIAYNISDSASDFESTPPQIVDQPLDAVKHLLSKKSKGKYEMVYEKFMSPLFFENVFLAYFDNFKEKSSLWAFYSLLRSTINIKDNVNIENYPKLRAFLKRLSDGFSSKFYFL